LIQSWGDLIVSGLGVSGRYARGSVIKGCVFAGSLGTLAASRRAHLRTLAAAVFVLSLTALLAPGRVEADGPGKVSPTYSWSGFYLGGHAGYAWGDVDFLDLGLTADAFAFHSSGVLAGGHIGFQQQWGRWVGGVELSLSRGRLQDDILSTAVLTSVLLTGDIVSREDKDDLQTRIDGLFLATARLGYASDRWLGYVKGGYAAADIKAGFHLSALATVVGAVTLDPGQVVFAGDSTGGSRERHHGWTIGAGLEYLLAPNVIFGVEYGYVNLRAQTHTAVASGFNNNFGTITTFTTPIEYRIDPDDIHSLTARLSFKFGTW
jgi:outer membrane immunogenic protein